MSHPGDPAFSQAENRVELITQSYLEEDAGMMYAIEPHPKGWCVAARQKTGSLDNEQEVLHKIYLCCTINRSKP